MDRRTFIGSVALGLLAAPCAEALPVEKVVRIGWLTPAVVGGESWRAFREALRSLGYVEGQTVAFESRSANDDLDLLPRLAAELVHAKVDIIVAVSAPAIRAARQATDTIPSSWRFGGRLV